MMRLGTMQSYEISSSSPYVQYCIPEKITVGIELSTEKGSTFEELKRFITSLGRGVDRVIADPSVGSPHVALFQKYGFKEIGQLALKGEARQIFAIDIRYTARALLLNQRQQLLLMKVEDDITIDEERKDGHFWVTIGGRVEKEETETQAVAREIVEETGMENAKVGDFAFYGEHTLLFYQFPVRLFEKFYFAHVKEEKMHQKNLTDNEKRIFREIRWWSLPELLTTREIFYPRRLAVELDDALKGGKIPREIIL